MKQWLTDRLEKGLKAVGWAPKELRVARSGRSSPAEFMEVWRDVKGGRGDSYKAEVACELLANPKLPQAVWAEMFGLPEQMPITKKALKGMWWQLLRDKKATYRAFRALNYGFLFIETWTPGTMSVDWWREEAKAAENMGMEHLWYRWVLRDMNQVSSSRWVSEPREISAAEWACGFLSDQVPWLIQRKVLHEIRNFEEIHKVQGLAVKLRALESEASKKGDGLVRLGARALLRRVDPVEFLQVWLSSSPLDRESLARDWLGELLLHPEREKRRKLIGLVAQVREQEIKAKAA